MESRSWTVTYRNRDNGQRITAAVFAADPQQAQKKAQADGQIAEFSKKQRGGHFACPRCGKMTMDAESVTHNALSRRATVYVCDTCGTEEALEDMLDERMPLTAWAITTAPENWRMAEGGEKHE